MDISADKNRNKFLSVSLSLWYLWHAELPHRGVGGLKMFRALVAKESVYHNIIIDHALGEIQLLRLRIWEVYKYMWYNYAVRSCTKAFVELW